MLKLRQAGAHTIAQSAASSVVDGMPRAARELGAAAEVADLGAMSDRILAAAGSFGEMV
jgi:two-component system chemotaxis response regulator CheB